MTRVLSKHPEFLHHTVSLDAVLRAAEDEEGLDSKLRETESHRELPASELPSSTQCAGEADTGAAGEADTGAAGGTEGGESTGHATQVLAGEINIYAPNHSSVRLAHYKSIQLQVLLARPPQ